MDDDDDAGAVFEPLGDRANAGLQATPASKQRVVDVKNGRAQPCGARPAPVTPGGST